MEKLKEIIEQIKKSIPFFSKGKNVSLDHNDDEVTAPNHGLKDLKDKLDGDSSEGENLENKDKTKPELSDADKDRKKKIMIIVVLAMAYFLFGPEDEEKKQEVTENQQLPKKEKNKQDIKNKIENVSNDQNNESDEKVTKSDEVETSQQEFIIPDENKVEEVDDTPVIKSPEKLSDLTNYGETVSFGDDVKEQNNEKQLNQDAENPFESLPNVQDLNLDNGDSIPTEGESDFNTFNKISEKIDEDLNKKKMIKVNYESLGRGLAYNCELGYWVCLNKQEYTNCRENLKWAIKVGNKKECVPQDVYAGIKDCQIMQVHFINTNSAVSFCE